MSFNGGIKKISAGKNGFSTDVFANKGKVYIEFFHIPSGETVKFKGFITDFKDNYNLDFNREQVYGRMDPIVTYKNTNREITIGWTVVAESEQEALENWKNVQKYVKMLYPSYVDNVYSGKFSATMLATPPLLRMKFMNLAMNTNSGAEVKSERGSMIVNKNTLTGPKRIHNLPKLKFFGDKPAETGGLLVAPGNISIDPNLPERGALLFGKSPERRNAQVTAIPLEVSMSSTYIVLHDHNLGWSRKVNQARLKKIADQYKKELANAAKEKNKKKSNSMVQKANKARKDALKKRGLLGGIAEQKGFENFPYGLEE